MFTRIHASLAAAVLACGAACAQDESRPAQPRTDSAPLEKALATLLDSKGFRLTGDASSVRAEEESGGGAHVMVIGAGGGSAGTAFSGAVEIARTPKGELLIASKSKLPGFAALETGERSVTTTTFESDPVDPSVVVGDLAAVLSQDELVKAAQTSTSLASKTDETAGTTRWTFALPKRLAKSSGGDGPLAFTKPRVKALKAAVTTGKDGAVTILKISVTRTDPMARVKKRAMESGGGGTATIGADDMGGDEDGATAVYTLRPAAGEMSQRAKDALAHLQKALSDG